jgi:hypothetical protein
MEGRLDCGEDPLGIHAEFRALFAFMLRQSDKIDRAKCVSYYREHFLRTGEYPPFDSSKDACTTDLFYTRYSASSINNALEDHPHLVYCEGKRYSEYVKPKGVVRLKPEQFFPK